MSSPASPSLSVVVVRFAGGDALAGALAALAAQRGAPPFEVIVAQDEAAPAVAIPPALAGVVKTVVGRRGAGPAILRALGVRASIAAVIAVTEDHIVPAADWCAQVLAAHERHPAAAIGGTIAPAPTLRGGDLAFFLLAYARYLPPLPMGPADFLSDCNVTYKRKALEGSGDVWREEFVETVVHDALRRAGGALVLDPAIQVTQGRAVDLRRARAEQREHGEEFARGRVAGASPATRAVRAVSAFVLPVVLSARAAARAVSRGCSAGAVAMAIPSLFSLAAAWSAGELRGYLSPRD